MKKLFTSLFFVSVVFACQKDTPVSPDPAIPIPTTSTYLDGSTSVHLTLGNPSSAVNNPANATNFLLIKEQYLASYNNQRGLSNWTAWHIDKSDLGTAKRQDDFRPDTSLPADYYQIKPTDYKSTDGFDRGHMCPSADRTSTIANNSATFFMTNMAPQAPDLNRGLWEELEAFCREQVYAGNEVYVYAGGYGSGGDGSKGVFTTIADGKLAIPSRYYKIVLILPEGNDDLKRINDNTTVLAIDVPNSQSLADKNWEDYITTVSSIEQATKLNFWSNITASTQKVLKQKKYQVTQTSIPSSGTTTTPSTTTSTGPVTATTTSPVTTTTAPPVSTTTTPPTSTTTTTPSTTTTTGPVTTTTTSPVTTTTTSPGSTTTSNPVTTTTTTPESGCGVYRGRTVYKGPQGGCYYINSNGNKTYVDRSYCNC